jgi:hypothetical protein
VVRSWSVVLARSRGARVIANPPSVVRNRRLTASAAVASVHRGGESREGWATHTRRRRYRHRAAPVQVPRWSAAAPRRSFRGLRCSRGPQPYMDPRVAIEHGYRMVQGASCHEVVVARPGCGFPGPIVRAIQAASCSEVRQLRIRGTSSPLVASGSRRFCPAVVVSVKVSWRRWWS